MNSKRYARTMVALAIGAALGVAGSAAVRTTFPPSAAAPADAPSAIESALDRPVPEVNLVDVPWRDAVARIGQAAGVRIEVDDAASNPADVPADRLVTIRAKNRPLNLLLDDLAVQGSADINNSGPAFDWAADRDRVVFAVRGHLVPGMVVTRLYDVRDILAGMEPALDMSDERNWMFRGFSPHPPEVELVSLVEVGVGRVPPWDNRQGPENPVRAHLAQGRLIVSDTHSVHRQVRDLLAHLRESRPEATSRPARPPVQRWRGDLGRWTFDDLTFDESKLREPVAEFRTEAVPLRAALQQWATAAGVAAAFDPAVDAADADFDRPVAAFGLRNAAAHEVLRTILDGGVRPAAGAYRVPDNGRPRLSWWYDGDTVVIGLSADAARLRMLTRAYDLRDWLDAACEAAGAVHPGDRELARIEAANDLERRMAKAIGPQEWQKQSTSSNSEVAGRLLVTQTPENLLMIERLIRETRGAARPAGGNR